MPQPLHRTELTDLRRAAQNQDGLSGVFAPAVLPGRGQLERLRSAV